MSKKRIVAHHQHHPVVSAQEEPQPSAPVEPSSMDQLGSALADLKTHLIQSFGEAHEFKDDLDRVVSIYQKIREG